MSGTLPTHRPSGSVIEQPLATVALGTMLTGFAVVGLTYAGGVFVKNTAEKVVVAACRRLPFGGPT